MWPRGARSPVIRVRVREDQPLGAVDDGYGSRRKRRAISASAVVV